MTVTRVWGDRPFGAMEFFSKVARPPILAGRLLASVGEEGESARKATQRERARGPAMGPTNLDVTADAAHLSAHFTSSGQWEGARLVTGKNWQELADREPSFPFHGSRIWETGALDWDCD